MPRIRILLFTLAWAAAPLAAQGRSRPQASAAGVRTAVATITEADYRRRINLLADDSMGGRGTPSRGLEKAAAWIASEFQRVGLAPGGDSGTYFQRYRIVREVADTAAFAMVMGRGAHGHWQMGRDANVVAGGLSGPRSGPVVLISGVPADTARPFGDTALRGAIVLNVVSLREMRSAFPLIQKAEDAGAAAWILAVDYSPQQWQAMQRVGARGQLAVAGGERSFAVLAMRDSSAAGVLRAAGEDLATVRQHPGVRALSGFEATLDLRRRILEDATAPNVIGVLEGSDPALRGEYVFFTAHMDHVGVAGAGNGCSAVGADSICNGADDDASGTTGILELAEAFATLQPRPRRSLVFMTVSGEERDLWGSRWYSDHPTLPLEQTVADINLDMIGRNWRDTIVVIGKEHSTLGATVNRVAEQHPELNMRPIDDLWPEERFYWRSDHFNFARKGVPILFFFNGVHPDYHRVSDHPDRIDAEKAARITQMVFYVGLDVANATERPQWNPESRRQIVEPATP